MMMNNLARQVIRTSQKQIMRTTARQNHGLTHQVAAVQHSSPPTMVWVGYGVFMATATSWILLCQQQKAKVAPAKQLRHCRMVVIKHRT
jgi:hypothetical protein